MSSNQQDVATWLVTLDERIDIGRVEAVYSKFEESLQRTENVDIDASGVERIDTSGFQVVVAFCRAIEKSGRSVRITAVSEAFRSNARLLGLEPHLPIHSQ